MTYLARNAISRSQLHETQEKRLHIIMKLEENEKAMMYHASADRDHTEQSGLEILRDGEEKPKDQNPLTQNTMNKLPQMPCILMSQLTQMRGPRLPDLMGEMTDVVNFRCQRRRSSI